MSLVLLTFCCILPHTVTPEESPDTLSIYLRQVLEELRSHMHVGIPAVKLPALDPLLISNIDETIQAGSMKFNLRMNDLKITGLRQFNLKTVKVDLSAMKAKIRILVPKLAALGEYNLDGKIIQMTKHYGNGSVHLSVINLDVGIDAGLSYANNQLQLSSIDPSISLADVKVEFENLLGSMSGLLNFFLNALGKKLFNKHKADIESALRGLLKDAVNKELRHLDMSNIAFVTTDKRNLTAEGNSYVDNLLKSLKPFIEEYDPLHLPGLFNAFEKRIGPFVLKGYANFTSRFLKGLSSLRRTGDVDLQFNELSGRTSAGIHIGISKARVFYKTHLYIEGAHSHPSVTAHVSNIIVFCRVTFNIKTGYRRIDDFRITAMENPKISVTDLSGFGWLVSHITNLVITPILSKVKATIEKDIRAHLTTIINKLQIPFYP